MFNSVISSSLKGIQSGIEAVNRGASKISEAFNPKSDQDPVEGFIETANGARQVEASAKVIKATDDLSGNILDILA